MQNIPTVLDLFCGAGGLSLGFQDAGFKILGGVDHDLGAIKTYAHNFSGSHAWHEDLTNPSDAFKTWMATQVGKVDVIVGGPPCQGFSIAGKRDPSDPRNYLFQNYLDIVLLIKPKFVVIENVPNIATMNGGLVKQAILNDLQGLGYETHVDTLNASFYGVPQSRKRTFFVGSSNKYSFVFPSPTTQSIPVTCREALSDLPSLDTSTLGVETKHKTKPSNQFQRQIRRNSPTVFNHEIVRHTDQTKNIIALVPDGGNYKDLPEELRDTRRVNIAWTRMNSNKPCFTIDAGHNHHFHYSENRVPSVRECARIQTFPDNFEFLGTRTSQYRQVGNAVPPGLAQVIACEVQRALS